MVSPVKDHKLIAQLEAEDSGDKPVTDPNLLAALEGKDAPTDTLKGKTKMDMIVEAGRALGRAAGSSAAGLPGEMAGYFAGGNPEALANAGPALGATAGGMLAAPIGLAPAGAGVGAMAGEGLKQADLALMGKGKPMSFPERVMATGQAGALGAAGEGALRGAGVVGKATGADKILPWIGRGISRGSELLTGTDASVFQKIAKEPDVMLPSNIMGIPLGPKSIKNASRAYGAHAERAGFVKATNAAENVPGLSKFQGMSSPFKDPGSVADKYFERVAAGESLTPQETFEAYQASGDKIFRMPRKDPTKVKAIKFREALQEELLKIDPSFAQTMEDYGASATGEKGTNILPRTMTGRVSQGRLGFNAMIGNAAEDEGSVWNLIKTVGASSPVVHGTAAAGAGTVAKIAAEPAVQRFSLHELLQRLKRGRAE